MMHRTRFMRHGILILSILVACMTLFSFFHAVHIRETGHCCEEKNCPVCAVILQHRNSLRQTAGGTASRVSAGIVLLGLHCLIVFLSADALRKTPVTEKVRLNQ